MSTKKTIWSIIINSVIVVSVAAITIARITCQKFIDYSMLNLTCGWDFLRMFTADSNIILAVYSVITIICNVKMLVKKESKPQHKAIIIHHIGTTLITLMFFTVVLFLSPMNVIESGNIYDYFNELVADLIFLHVISPILAIISFMLQRDNEKITAKQSLFAVIPMMIYSIVYMIMVVVVKAWPDFYGFTFGGQYQFIPVVLLGMYSITFAIAILLSKIHNKIN